MVCLIKFSIVLLAKQNAKNNTTTTNNNNNKTLKKDRIQDSMREHKDYNQGCQSFQLLHLLPCLLFECWLHTLLPQAQFYTQKEPWPLLLVYEYVYIHKGKTSLGKVSP